MALRIFLLCLCFIFLGKAFAKSSEAKLRGQLVQLENLIASKYARDHRRLQAWLKRREGKMPRTPNKLLKSYYFLGSINSQIWVNHPTDNAQQDDVRYRRARSFLEVCALYEYDIDRVEEKLDILEQVRQIRVKSEYHHHWRLSAQFLSYQESATLSDTNGTETIYSPQRGLCVGGQWGYGNVYREWTIDGCYYNVKGNVSTETTSRYFQSGITTNGFLFKPTYWKLLSEGQAGIGFGVTALVRRTNFTEPNGTSVKSRLAVPFGASLEGRWKLSPRWMFTTSAGYMDASLLWSLGGLYEL